MAAAVVARERGPILAGLAVTLTGAALAIAALVLILLDLDYPPTWALPGLSPEWTYALQIAKNTIGVMTISIVAGLVIRRQPRSAFALTFAGTAILTAVWLFTSQYAIHGLVVVPGSLPGALFAARIQPLIDSLLPVGYMTAVLLFPNGRLQSASWRVLVVAIIAVGIVDVLRRFDAPYPLEIGPAGRIGVPVTGVPELWAIGRAFAWSERWVFWGIYAILGMIAVAVIVRLRAATGDTRQQLKWFTYTIALGVAVAALTRIDGIEWIRNGLGDTTWAIRDWAQQAQDLVILALVPASIGIAIMRYRLYDIDVVVSRTIVFGGLAAFVTATYGLLVATIGGVLGQSVGLGPVATVVAIAVIALLLEPVRARLSALANMAIYGRRANPYEVLSTFAQSVKDATTTGVLLPRMARLVRDATHATSVEVWVRVGDRLQLAAAEPSAAATSAESIAVLERQTADAGAFVPVFDQSEPLGAIVVRMPRGADLSRAERRLLSDLASQAGLVFSRFRLVEELRESRARIVAAQDEERRRIERDLHDGAQQRFVNAMLSVGMAQALDGKGGDPTELLSQASREMQAGLVELRALARGVHPPLLTDEGLPAAIASLADGSPILTSVRITPERRYAEPVEATAYFVVAEALQNAAKHSRASKVDVSLNEVAGRLRIEVRDDGVGGADPSRGSGIVGLRDRAAAIGGRVDVESSGRGTVVRAEIPCA